ncbi:MAG: winged helix DNA-binding protein [Myxococcales bacterium FL481]|nr:MAG: winged helix DNA-binding protein [Myxococcales bacterium FL481]
MSGRPTSRTPPCAPTPATGRYAGTATTFDRGATAPVRRARALPLDRSTRPGRSTTPAAPPAGTPSRGGFAPPRANQARPAHPSPPQPRRGLGPGRAEFGRAVAVYASNVAPVQSQADEVLRAIRRIVRRVSEHSRYLSREVGLTVPQLLCLRAIGVLEEAAEPAEITVAMVGTSVQLSAPTVSRIVDRLERAGLVVRQRRAKDRRKVCLSLTPAGLERYQNLPEPLQEVFISRFDRLPRRRRDEILSALEEVSCMMQAEELDAAPVLTPSLDVQQEEAAGI